MELQPYGTKAIGIVTFSNIGRLEANYGVIGRSTASPIIAQSLHYCAKADSTNAS
jgi:hypothetical protein